MRSYGWTVLLADQGPVNYALMGLGLVTEPLELVFNPTGVVISLTHVFPLFVVFPILARCRLTRFREAHMISARRLGGRRSAASRFHRPCRVVAGAQIAFTLALGAL